MKFHQVRGPLEIPPLEVLSRGTLSHEIGCMANNKFSVENLGVKGAPEKFISNNINLRDLRMRT